MDANLQQIRETIVSNPEAFDTAMSNNPLLARALADALSIDRSTTRMKHALHALPAVPAGAQPNQPHLTSEYQVFADLANGTLEVRQGTHSAYECRLTLKAVEPGKTQEKLEALVQEMNAMFLSLANYPMRGWKVYLSGNQDLPNYAEAGDIVITMTSLITDSTNRHRSQTVSINGEERISQEALLTKLGLDQVNNDFARAMAGMFRLKRGFPASREEIGTELDLGDLFEGRWVRTKMGSDSGSVKSYRDWLGGSLTNAHGQPRASIGVVGGVSVEFKER